MEVSGAQRRRGRLGAWRAAAIVGLVVYGLALVVWTLLPFPDPARIDCVDARLDPLETIRGVAGALGPGDPLAEPVVLQLMLGVVVFLPLGFLVRVVRGRGILVSTAAGLALALLIELTQLTGVWGVYPCAYRAFGVGDLLAGALGAAFGAVGSLALPRTWRAYGPAARDDAPRAVSRGRRGVAMACDWVSVYFIGLVAATPVAAVLHVTGGEAAVEASAVALDAVSTYTAITVTGAVAVLTGRTIGDRIMQLEYRGSAMPRWAARALRFLAGIGGYQVLTAFTEGANPVSFAYVVVSIVLFFTTAKGRGLPGLASRQVLADVRTEPGPAGSPSPSR